MSIFISCAQRKYNQSNKPWNRSDQSIKTIFQLFATRVRVKNPSNNYSNNLTNALFLYFQCSFMPTARELTRIKREYQINVLSFDACWIFQNRQQNSLTKRGWWLWLRLRWQNRFLNHSVMQPVREQKTVLFLAITASLIHCCSLSLLPLSVNVPSCLNKAVRNKRHLNHFYRQMKPAALRLTRLKRALS